MGVCDFVLHKLCPPLQLPARSRAGSTRAKLYVCGIYVVLWFVPSAAARKKASGFDESDDSLKSVSKHIITITTPATVEIEGTGMPPRQYLHRMMMEVKEMGTLKCGIRSQGWNLA